MPIMILFLSVFEMVEMKVEYLKQTWLNFLADFYILYSFNSTYD